MVAHPMYAPVYRLLINGSELPAAVRTCVMSVRYEDGMEGADQVQITLANPDLRFLQSHIRGLGTIALPTGVSVGTFARLDAVPGGLFDMDNKVALAFGYAPDPPEELFLGEITGVGATFPNGGMPTLTITAHDFLQRTTRGRLTRGFGPLPDAAIVALLAAENGLLPLIDPSMFALDAINSIANVLFGTATKQTEGQCGQTDFELLKQIAARYDMDLSVDHYTMYLTRFIKEYSPRLTLRYGQSLLDFSPRVSSVGTATAVSKRVSLREVRIDLLISIGWDFDRESIAVSVLPAAAAGAAKAAGVAADESCDRPIRNPMDVGPTLVEMIGELRHKINNRLTGSGTAVGDPRIRAGAVMGLEGLGVDFSGNYRVTKASHTLDTNGYRTSFEVQREIIP